MKKTKNIKKKFFNEAFKLFKSLGLQNKTILAACSGGLDSAALLRLLKELSKPCKLKLYAVHIHHGPVRDKNIQSYRDKAQRFTEQLAQSLQIDFLCLGKKRKKILKSEEEFRNLRYFYLEKLLKEKKAHAIALAHNKNDLLETRLIQLIRGCGEEGLKSMPIWTGPARRSKTLQKKAPKLRPLLLWTRNEIQSYARENNLKWLEDPSNKSLKPLRNWMRNKWLPDLEKKRAGSVRSLSRSLESISPSLKKDSADLIISSKGIDRRLLMEAPLPEQKRILALYMRSRGFSGYGQSHIQEVLKHLERAEKTFSIKILKKTWIFTKSRINAK